MKLQKILKPAFLHCFLLWPFPQTCEKQAFGVLWAGVAFKQFYEFSGCWTHNLLTKWDSFAPGYLKLDTHNYQMILTLISLCPSFLSDPFMTRKKAEVHWCLPSTRRLVKSTMKKLIPPYLSGVWLGSWQYGTGPRWMRSVKEKYWAFHSLRTIRSAS